MIQDSGAFSDGPGHRLSFEQALERQVRHAEQFGYVHQITHRASYDHLVGEKRLEDGGRNAKHSDEAEAAVAETIAAAQFMAKHKGHKGAILTAQGATPQQYMRCAEQIIPLVEPERDIFGLGGFCLIGIKPKQYLPVFLETISLLIPRLAQAGIIRAHLWGVCYIKALGPLQWLCDRHGIATSMDSAGPVVHPSFGQWGYDTWRDVRYRRAPILTSCKEHRYSECCGCLGLDKIRHVALTHQWLAHIRESKHYHAPIVQTLLFQEAQI